MILTAVQERSLDYARDDDGAKRYQNSAALRLFKEDDDEAMYKNPYEI